MTATDQLRAALHDLEAKARELELEKKLEKFADRADHYLREAAVKAGDYAHDNRDRVEGVIAREAEAALAEWAAGRAVDDILLTGSGDLPRWLAPRLQARLEPYRLGVRVQHASVALLAPPDRHRAGSMLTGTDESSPLPTPTREITF